MPDVKAFVEAMEKNRIPANIIEKILKVDYQNDDNPQQDNANYYAKAMPECEKLLGFACRGKHASYILSLLRRPFYVPLSKSSKSEAASKKSRFINHKQ